MTTLDLTMTTDLSETAAIRPALPQRAAVAPPVPIPARCTAIEVRVVEDWERLLRREEMAQLPSRGAPLGQSAWGAVWFGYVLGRGHTDMATWPHFLRLAQPVIKRVHGDRMPA